MKVIDLKSWPRRAHYELFKSFEYPYFSVTTELDVTEFRKHLKGRSLPFHPVFVFQASRVANEIEEFRTRIRGDEVVVHETIDPSFTVPWKNDLFNFCTVRFQFDENAFVADCIQRINDAESSDSLILDEPGRDDFLFLSCLPWLPLTSMTHPVSPSKGDSVPRIAWGKITERDGRSFLSINLQLHHALADGLHLARFITRLQEILDK